MPGPVSDPAVSSPDAAAGAESAARGALGEAVDAFAAKVRAAGAQLGHDASTRAARLSQDAKDHPLETVTGAFGLGYLVGKALFRRRQE